MRWNLKVKIIHTLSTELTSWEAYRDRDPEETAYSLVPTHPLSRKYSHWGECLTCVSQVCSTMWIVIFCKWVSLKNIRLKNIKQTCLLKCLPLPSVWIFKGGIPYAMFPSYLITECYFHTTNISKNTLEKICLPHSPQQLQVRSQMRHNLWWFISKKKEVRPH